MLFSLTLLYKYWEVINKSKTDIVIQILETANDCEDDDDGGITFDKLMQNVFLGIAQEYLKFLMVEDLLKYNANTQTFKITEKGRTFLQGYRKMDQALKEQQI
jgi:predicted transcriptional regulator